MAFLFVFREEKETNEKKEKLNKDEINLHLAKKKKKNEGSNGNRLKGGVSRQSRYLWVHGSYDYVRNANPNTQ